MSETIQKNRFSRYLNVKTILIVILAVTLLPLFVLSVYNHPTYQDYFEAWFTARLGPWGAQKFFYENWQGRYTESFLESINPLTFGLYWPYRVNPIILLSLLTISVFLLVKQLFANSDFKTHGAITSLFIVSFMVIMPQLFSCVYWQGGMDDDFLPDVLTVFLLLNIVRYYATGGKLKYIVFSMLLIALTIGCYDIHMMNIDIITTLILFIAVIRKKKLFYPGMLFLTALLSSTISFTAPGNKIRSLIYPNAHHFLPSLKKSLYWGTNILLHWHWILLILVVSVIIYHLLSKRELWNIFNNSIFNIHPLIGLSGTIAVVYISIFFFYWAEGRDIAPQMNTLNAIYFYFVLGMFYTNFCFIKFIHDKFPEIKPNRYLNYIAYLVLMYILLLKPNNIKLAYLDITSGVAAKHDKERTDIENYLSTTKEDSCTINATKYSPTCLPNFDYVGGMSGDGENHFSYYECCFYYHKRAITIKQ